MYLLLSNTLYFVCGVYSQKVWVMPSTDSLHVIYGKTLSRYVVISGKIDARTYNFAFYM